MTETSAVNTPTTSHAAPALAPGADADDDGVRRCGHSRCRRPLPYQGTGRKLDYCPARTWPTSGGRDATCRELCRAENLLRAVHGDGAVPDITVIELSEHVTATLGPVGDFLTALREVRTQLDGSVAQALQERDEANRLAAEEEGKRLASDHRALVAKVDARTARDEAEQAREHKRVAESKAERSAQLQRHAEDARTTAAAALDAANQRAERAETRADEARQRADELGQQVAGLKARLDAMQSSLGEAQQRAAAATERATTLASEAASRIEQIQRDHTLQLQQAQQADAARHAEALSALHQTIGRLEHQQGEANQEREQLRTTVTAWRAALVAALTEPLPDGGEDPVRVRARELLLASEADPNAEKQR